MHGMWLLDVGPAEANNQIMNVELENDGEKKTVTVGQNGQVYIGQKYVEKEIELAWELKE